MAGAIAPGDFVECVKADTENPFGLIRVFVGSVYRVRDVADTGRYCAFDECRDTLGLLLVGDPAMDAVEGAHCGCTFRPVYRPNADIIASLKAPSPKRELADA